MVGESPTEDHQIQSLWSNQAKNGSGYCVNSLENHLDDFFTACGGHLRHYTGVAGGTTDDFGNPGVSLALDTQHAGVGAASWGYGRLDAFAVDSNGNVEHFYQELDGNHVYETAFGEYPWGTWLQDQSDVDVCSGVDLDSW